MKEIVQKYQFIISLLVIFLVTIPIIIPYLQAGFYTSHDGEWTVIRLADMFRTIRDGQIPARYSNYLNMQYGYPLFNFAYPLPYYVGLVPVLLKFGYVNSIKLLFVLSTLLSGIGMFFLGKHLWKSTFAGVVAAVLFLYLPYRFVDMFVRGSLGEIVAFAIIPFLFTSMYLVITKKSWFYTSTTGLLLGLLLLSHNIQSLLFAPILVVFASVLAYEKKNNSSRMIITSLLLGIGIAAFFVIPALFEKENILLSVIPIADRTLYFVSLSQLIIPSWGYGVPTDTTQPFTYQLGIAQLTGLILLLLSFSVTFFGRKQKLSPNTSMAAVILCMILVAILMLFSFSKPIWELLPLLSEINYPWTLLGPIGFLLALGIGYLATLKKFAKVAAVLVGVSIITTISYAKPENIVDRGDDYYSTNMGTTTSSNEYTPLWVKEQPLHSYDQKVTVENNAKISNIMSNSRQTSFIIDSPSTATFTVNTIYYPGWTMSIDDIATEPNYQNPKGLLTGSVPKGTHRVTVDFTETPMRIVANSITIMSIGISLSLLIFYYKREFHAKP